MGTEIAMHGSLGPTKQQEEEDLSDAFPYMLYDVS